MTLDTAHRDNCFVCMALYRVKFDNLLLNVLPSALDLCFCGHVEFVHWSTSPPYPGMGCRDCIDCPVYEEAPWNA